MRNLPVCWVFKQGGRGSAQTVNLDTTQVLKLENFLSAFEAEKSTALLS